MKNQDIEMGKCYRVRYKNATHGYSGLVQVMSLCTYYSDPGFYCFTVKQAAVDTPFINATSGCRFQPSDFIKEVRLSDFLDAQVCWLEKQTQKKVNHWDRECTKRFFAESRAKKKKAKKKNAKQTN